MFCFYLPVGRADAAEETSCRHSLTRLEDTEATVPIDQYGPPLAANCIVDRTALICGLQVSSSNSVFPPIWNDKLVHPVFMPAFNAFPCSSYSGHCRRKCFTVAVACPGTLFRGNCFSQAKITIQPRHIRSQLSKRWALLPRPLFINVTCVTTWQRAIDFP